MASIGCLKDGVSYVQWWGFLQLRDAKKYLLALGRSGGSPSSTNVMCLDMRGRDRWDWEGTKYHMKNKFPPQGGGGN